MITRLTLIARLLRLFIVAGLFSVLSACATSSSKNPQLTGVEHPLAGKIWDARNKRYIDQAAIVEQVLSTEYLLLGERHDNPVHHQHQVWIIRQLRQNQRRASVAFEMIDNEQGNRLAKQHITSADQMIELLNQTDTNWQYQTHYKGLFSEVLAAGYRIDAANLDGKQLMQDVARGEDRLAPAYKRILSRTPLTHAQWTALRKDIRESHCNMLDDQTIETMAQAQRLRDVIMAHRLSESEMPLKVLISGAGHARNDRGVPIYLGKQVKVLSVGFIEVESGLDQVTSYSNLWDADKLLFDLVWFTPRMLREDPCENFMRRIKRQSVTD
jgi:uncharacterized iron-regulated protein